MRDLTRYRTDLGAVLYLIRNQQDPDAGHKLLNRGFMVGYFAFDFVPAATGMDLSRFPGKLETSLLHFQEDQENLRVIIRNARKRGARILAKLEDLPNGTPEEDITGICGCSKEEWENLSIAVCLINLCHSDPGNTKNAELCEDIRTNIGNPMLAEIDGGVIAFGLLNQWDDNCEFLDVTEEEVEEIQEVIRESRP